MTTTYYDLSSYGHIEVSGPEADTFLQGQLTCDINTVDQTQSILGAHCNLKGRMVSLFWLYRMPECFRLVMPVETIPRALKHLQKFAAFSKVTISCHDGNYLGLVTKHSPNADTGLFRQIDDDQYLCFASSTTAISPQQPLSAWEQFCIQRHQAYLTPKSIAELMPSEIELGKLGGVSLNKGCFLGQEIIARLHYLGKQKKTLVVLEAEDQPSVLESLLDAEGKTCGQIICASTQLSGKQYCLALVNNNAIATDPSWITADTEIALQISPEGSTS